MNPNPTAFRRPALLALLLLAACPCTAAPGSGSAPPLQCVIVGGGPTPSDNEVAIESNVRYIRHILPQTASALVLFADGHPRHVNVEYYDGWRDHFRASQIRKIDGSNEPDDVAAAINRESQPSSTPLLLYFTGHGSPDDSGRDNCTYASWGGQSIRVSDLRHMLDLAGNKPVTLVMVQCFSGAFATLILNKPFSDASQPSTMPSPTLSPSEPPAVVDAKVDNGIADDVRLGFCGFFASLSTREAAGCTDEVDQAYYHDFTSYFFAALCGKDRLGRPTTGADYNHDGKVGMDEAFAYAQIHDISIDTPVCTSDIFLRAAVDVPDREVFKTPYSTVRGWATPAQGAVLDALSDKLSLSGENRLLQAYDAFSRRMRWDVLSAPEDTALWVRFVRTAKDAALRHIVLVKGSPELQAAYLKLEGLEDGNPLKPGDAIDDRRPGAMPIAWDRHGVNENRRRHAIAQS